MKISFEKKKDYIYFKISGSYDDSEAFDKVKEVFDITKKHGYRRFLTDVRDLDYDFNTMYKYDFAVRWNEFIIKKGVLKSAVLVNSEKFDTFSEDVVVNRGGYFKIFTEEQEAIDWLEENK